MKKYSYLILLIIGIYISPLCLAEYDIVVMLEGDDDRVKANQFIEGSDGALYGTNERGGEFGSGSIFKINKNGSGYQVLHSFAGDPLDGVHPSANVIEGSDGILYGTTGRGGIEDGGIIFAIHKDGSNYRRIFEFSSDIDIVFPAKGTLAARKANVLFPTMALLEASDGMLYGTTTSHCGTPCSPNRIGDTSIFKINKDGSGFAIVLFLKTVIDESENFDLGNPSSTLIEGNDVYLYSIASSLFKVSKDGSDVKLLVDSTKQGRERRIHGFDIINNDGVIYGINREQIYKINEDGTDFAVLRNFTNNSKFPNSPQSGLVLDDTGGVLYGVANNIAYQLNTDGTGFTMLTERILSRSVSPPVLASDGALYGSLTFNGHCEVGIVRGIFSLKNSVETIFDWAETNFPQHFPTKEKTQISAPWSFRYYPTTNIYLGVNNDDNGVYVLGGTFGGTPLRIDSRESILNQAIGVNAVLCGN